MKILFHRYGNICEPDILSIFRQSGIEVSEEAEEITRKCIEPEERVRLVTDYLFSDSYTFVFSINFFPYLSEICERFRIPYVCFSVDCPVLELFSSSIQNSWNRIFLFDYTQYLRFAETNPQHIYYLPLATNTGRWDKILSSLSADDRKKYSCDISFVGSLYNEKSPLSGARLPEHIRGYVDGVVEAQLKVYGYNFLEEVITPELIATLKSVFPDYPSIPGSFANTDAYVAANHYLGMRVSELERIRTLDSLSQKHPVTLYTRSETSSILSSATVRGGVSTLHEMPMVFHLSKINLNITIKPIQSGLSLRIWDILGCGGFLLTNFQSELTEYFEIGKDLECYESMTDLEEKVLFYLAHDDIRMEIAHNGYEKVKTQHTWAHRIAQMLRIIIAEYPAGT